MEFFSRDAGQARRAWLNALADGAVQFVPPELRPWLGIANELNPVVSIERAGTNALAVADPNVQGWDKVAAVGDTVSNMANALAPVALGSRGAVPAVQAAEEALLGMSWGSPMAFAARDFVTDEFGGVGFRAYHGSPHDFDRFSLDKIGTGEGAQAYGHGLYFADSEDVARSYRDNLSLPTGTTARDTAARILDEHGGDYEAALTDIGARFNRALANGRMEPAEYDRWMKAQRMLMNKDPVLGRMYEVQINADPNDFLDWDKPLSEQPRAEQVVGRYLEQALNQPGPINEDLFRRFESGAMTGQDAARMVGENTAPLREAGIPGIRYLDAGSRGAGDGSRNYVVFDDKLIEIIRKYGWAAAAPIFAASGLTVEEAQAQYEGQM